MLLNENQTIELITNSILAKFFSNGISVADNQSKISRLCCTEKKYNIQSVPRIEIFAECLKKYNDMANYLQSIQGQ